MDLETINLSSVWFGVGCNIGWVTSAWWGYPNGKRFHICNWIIFFAISSFAILEEITFALLIAMLSNTQICFSSKEMNLMCTPQNSYIFTIVLSPTLNGHFQNQCTMWVSKKKYMILNSVFLKTIWTEFSSNVLQNLFYVRKENGAIGVFWNWIDFKENN